ncbi:hypothetical protein AGABI1DRAFT_130618 [Agaricus bisporus var. burnettii JB137-S8]|uniref:F-box domain-containing protein n=1 Tax=Agaricus bisporus var. burnettii (strain JB137-S8 / ATCC MYA-4627 / FGSC 10392) TaxID=597362 RepID=K5WPE9_AGABU|nr:uncharacterized protein AGABI1DRAFT_130618 [Agaricus bisporus var. burnettii JB137-S8]EKM77201.1 hypothetical protein AGABI1DRAFT_130618 [Agaricus bisporus var. burnettii JB137-S8]
MLPCAYDLYFIPWTWNFFLSYFCFLLPLLLRLKGHRHVELVSLPIEIVNQVFLHLDIPSVLAVRLSCKTFYSVTKTRQFWYSRVSQLIETRYVCPPEENVDEYNVDELERWVRRRSRPRDVFASHSQQPSFHERTLDLQPLGLSNLEFWDFKLVPGGRWLLIYHPSVAMHFIDLDSPNPSPRLLFDPRKIDGEICKPKMVVFSIWIDKGAPRLSFRLAFVIFTKVDLADHGANATLVASNIAILRNFDLELWPMCTALNNRYLVQVWCGNDVSTTSPIGVYDYNQALGCHDYLMTRSSEHSIGVVISGNMEFICSDIFAMQNTASRSLSIFEIGPSASLILLHRIDMHSRSWSTIRWTPGASIITMMDNDGRGELQGLVIPHDPSCPPTIVVLGRCNKRKSCVYTLGTWLLVAREKVHEIFSHDWDLDSSINDELTLTSHCRVDFTTGFLILDEDTGRFLAYPCRRKLVIYDIV